MRKPPACRGRLEAGCGRFVFVECVYEKASLHLKVGVDAQLKVFTLRPSSGRPPEAFESAARALVGELSTGDWARAVARFSPQMTKGLPAEALAGAWASVVSSSGAFQRVSEVSLDPTSPPYTIAGVTCAFAKGNLTVRVVFDGSLVVNGLFFKPAWNPPPYADSSAFEERAVTVGAAAWPLPGTLSLPKGKGPFPVVILVHGSGPNDADESLGPNKVFKDLAWGLSPPSEAGAAAIAQAEESAKKLDDPKLKPGDVVDGLAGTYWLDMRNEDVAQTAAKLAVPLLVLQGERDYQVTMADFAGWKKALAGRKTATLKSYPALNHEFMPGTGKSTPAEYEQPNHVPLEVIDDLAKWLLAR